MLISANLLKNLDEKITNKTCGYLCEYIYKIHSYVLKILGSA
jgi:hypothetical protein